eukprot:3939797-Rhodomonas_salina.7
MVTGARVLNLVVVMWHMIQAAVIFALADPLDSANTSDVEYPLVKTVVRWYAVEDQGNVTADVPSVILAVNGSVSVVMQPALSSVQTPSSGCVNLLEPPAGTPRTRRSCCKAASTGSATSNTRSAHR